MESKPWFKSMTIVASFIGIALVWAQGQGFVSPEEVEATKALGERLVETATAIATALGIWGMRRAVSPIQGPGTKAGVATAAAMVAVAITGCASFDAVRVGALADRYGGDSLITMRECEAFLELAAALQDGPNVAVRYVGRAGELERLSQIAERHGAQCAEIMSRTGVSPEVEASLISSFDTTWAAAAEATQ